MEFDLIYPERKEDAFDAKCVIAAVFFDDEELQKFGVDSNSWELNPVFYDYNQLEKAFELWASPLFVSDFYDRFKSYLQEPYWRNISEDTFLKEVDKSRCAIKRAIYEAFENDSFYEMVEPLGRSDEENRLGESIRVKLKQGTIIGHHPFRFYAIEVEEKKCYLITGATIKVHKDMGKAENTKIELQKLTYTLEHLNEKEFNTKDIFVTQAL